ncbi:MAG: hypothetical protein FGM14_11590 [Flavobacteriales bacterium]|nr:hypothetical protein [Flavobacteriales bacterium]
MDVIETTFPFDVVSQKLEGNNSIEASAGTGKTYSLAILTLRLILEKKIPVEKILLVTFTEAAAAELKERAVKFIRLALQENEKKGASEDSTIQQIIENSKFEKEVIRGLLNQALLDIDKATMSTIHSFCQRTLNEFAFETGQVFGKELMTDISEIIEFELNEYWRTQITTTDYNFWQFLGIGERSVWKNALDKALNGQILLPPYRKLNSEAEISSLIEQQKTALINQFDKNLSELSNKIKGGGEKYLVSGNVFYNYLKKDPKFNFPEVFSKEIKLVRQNERFPKTLKIQVAHYHLQQAIEILIPKIKERIAKKNALTYDDLIHSLYEKRNDERLQRFLREKYQAVFVDEFQDTDPKQYAIFKCFFQESASTILFFIGDPKQSIYGWRQADLDTYRAARDSANMCRLTMNTNFRSSQSFVTAANEFFNADTDSKLSYIDVDAYENKEVGLAWVNNQEAFPSIHIQTDFPNEDLVHESIQSTLKLLFSGNLILNGAAIRPSNVAILVRTGRQGKAVKNILQKLKIPSVILQEESIFASEEAQELKAFLNAVLNISKSTIDNLLLTTLVGKTITELHQVNTDVVVPFFYELRETWHKEGIFVMTAEFIREFDLINKWKTNPTNGHQKLSNWQQLVDILQEKTLLEALTPLELYQFLVHKIKERPTGEYEQGIESDENAVKIMTIHKSKGLEFDIVLLPFLNLDNKEAGYTFTSFRKKDKDNNMYYFSLNGLKGDDLVEHKQQNQEENERLLYVALTRAKYNAFLLAKTKGHLLTPYVNALKNKTSTIQLQAYKEVEDWKSLSVLPVTSNNNPPLAKPFPLAKFPDKDYRKISYSFLAGKHTTSPKENSKTYTDESYDKFVFKDLPKGAHIGNLLHAIFEYIDFDDPSTWETYIQRSIQRYAPGKVGDTTFLNALTTLVQQTLGAAIQVGTDSIPLYAISRNKRVNELEFNFLVNQHVDYKALDQFFAPDSEREIHVYGKDVMGMMTGFIDLLFEHEGKFYILDWKSNFLGDELHHYDQQAVLNAMNENNYHLQYLIYALAVEKFLRSKIPDFAFEKHFGGVIYLFLRGTRTHENSGVFVQNVTAEEVTKLGAILSGN